jgi:nitrate reductase NapE component
MKIKTFLLLPLIVPIAVLAWLFVGLYSFLYWVTGSDKFL